MLLVCRIYILFYWKKESKIYKKCNSPFYLDSELWTKIEVIELFVFRNILGSGATSYTTCMDPLVPIFCIFALWRPATSVKIDDCLTNSYSYFVWMRSIDWYLNWPHRTCISCDTTHLLIPSHVGMEGFSI